MPVTQHTHKLRFHAIIGQIAAAFVCVSSPLVVINPTLAQLETETQMISHIQRLKNPQQRSAAIDDLVTVGKPAVPTLIKALQDSDPQVRSGAAIVLGKIGPEAAQAAPALLRTIDDQDATVRSHAVQAIKKIGKHAYIPQLIAGLDSDTTWERYSAAHALRALGKDAAPAVPALTKKLQDEDLWVRAGSASALGSIGKAATPSLPALIARLQDSDETVRYSAAYALGSIGVNLQENIKQLSKQELDTAITNLEKALTVLQNPSLKFREEAITSVSEPLTILKKERMKIN